MRRDWDRRARIDPRYWVAATQEADEASYVESAARDTAAFVEGLGGRVAATARVLDLGCGIGRMTAPLGDHFAEVVGVDVSPEMIEQAQSLHAARGNVRFAVNSGADLADFADASFELACSYSVLPHLPPEVVRAYLHEVGRVLAPGGWFRYQFWVGPAREMPANDTLNIRVWSPEAFEQLNREAGFVVEGTEAIDYFDPVLELRPIWVNARRVGESEPIVNAWPALEAASAEEERGLEYGLLVYLASRHAERGEADDAERVLEEAIQTDPTRPEAYVQWATHRIERDDLRGAARLFEALTENVPTLAIGWLYRAQAAEALDRRDEARAALARFDALPAEDELKAAADALRRQLRVTGRTRRPRTRLKKR
ncbi:MAG: methyltransferase domain-containing protein [Myxococcales bacterium]|nr:methyltransferase domain-containing protein [Myxococcales bacterium]